ncbi:MAG: hypothetical protein ACJAS1_005799 [Oleiphilaceae bacterium]|jgi:hypothetical protein
MQRLKNIVKKILGRDGVQYHIDTVSADAVFGWACNSLRPSRPCLVELKQADTVIASTQAATLREDLLTAGIGNGCHGFAIQLNMLPFSAEAREVHLFINNKRVTASPIVLKSSFTHILGDFAVEVEKRMDAMLSIQSERMQREFDYLKQQLEK